VDAISFTRAVACVLSLLRCGMEIPVRFSVYTAAHLVTFVVCHSPVCFHAYAGMIIPVRFSMYTAAYFTELTFLQSGRALSVQCLNLLEIRYDDSNAMCIESNR
jgi:hypothetical protein